MTLKEKNICIIPARGGSKRIPRKNIKYFLGKPIIAYSIEAALKSNLFDVVMVSTDDKEIAVIAEEFGAEVPFFRSAENSDDFASTIDVICEVLGVFKENGVFFDNFCCIYPTAPFVTSKNLNQAYSVLIEKKYDTVFPIVKYGYPIQRALKVKNGNVSMIMPEHLNARSQDLDDTFHDAGQFYWGDIIRVLNLKKLWTDNSGCIEVNELTVQDIDNEVDWELAKIKYKLINEGM